MPVVILEGRRITERQKVWLEAYLTTARYNATEAGRIAGYRWPNHSGPENLQKLRDVIDAAMEARIGWYEPDEVRAWLRARKLGKT